MTKTAAHVAIISSIYTTMLPTGPRTHPIPDLGDRIRNATLDEVAAVNEYALDSLTDRAWAALGDQVRDAVGQLLAMSEHLDPTQRVSWLGNAQVPVAGWYAHLLNELNLHGSDIAAAAGKRWHIPQRDAAMSFEMFLVTMLSGDTGHLLVNEPMASSRVAIRLRSRYTTPVVFAVEDNRIVIDPPNRTVDATLFFRPSALMRILFRRLGKPRAALTGQIAVWGPRPWRLPVLLRAVRFP